MRKSIVKKKKNSSDSSKILDKLKSQDNDIKYVKSHYEELMKETSRIIEVVEQYLNS